MKSNDMSFDKRADKYDEGFEGRLSKRFYRNLVNAVELKKGDSILDVGCGTGTILKKLSQLQEVKGYGIDVSDCMLSEAKHKCPNYEFQVGDSGALPYENNTMDVITACMAYHHFSNQEAFQTEAWRVLKPGGKLYICDPNFPSVVRHVIHGVLKIAHVNGRFNKPEVLKHDFIASKFHFVKLIKDKYVLVLVMQK